MGIANGVEYQGKALLNPDVVHLSGLSLGGITATSVAALIRDTQNRHFQMYDNLDIKSITLGVPGGGLASIIVQSPTLAEEVQRDIQSGAGFRLFMAELYDIYDPMVDVDSSLKVTALDRMDVYETLLREVDWSNTEDISDPFLKLLVDKTLILYREFAGDNEATLSSFDDFLQQVWLDFKPSTERNLQAVVDSADPVNMATTLAEYPDDPIFLVEAVGDGTNILDMALLNEAYNEVEGAVFNPGDFVIINQNHEMPLAGTDPLIRVLGLDILTEDISNATVVRGAARYGYGTHMSMAIAPMIDLLKSQVLPHDSNVRKSIISGMVSLARSGGTGIELKNTIGFGGTSWNEAVEELSLIHI